jgi:hypothetical protein
VLACASVRQLSFARESGAQHACVCVRDYACDTMRGAWLRARRNVPRNHRLAPLIAPAREWHACASVGRANFLVRGRLAPARLRCCTHRMQLAYTRARPPGDAGQWRRLDSYVQQLVESRASIRTSRSCPPAGAIACGARGASVDSVAQCFVRSLACSVPWAGAT